MNLFFRITILLTIMASLTVQAQNTDSLYREAMSFYNAGDYQKSSAAFTKIFNAKSYNVSTTILYDAACVFSLNGQYARAFDIFFYLAKEKLYSNIDRITQDTDLEKMRSMPEWKTLTEKMLENRKIIFLKRKSRIAPELLKAKEILMKDNGKMWGENIWNDNLLVLDDDFMVYSLAPFPGSSRSDSLLYSRKVNENTLSKSNSAQMFEGNNYAIVMTSYLADSSSTIIHELFHVLQNKHFSHKGEPVNYLDNYDAREWLRLEYQALRNALNSIISGTNKSVVEMYVNDAIQYRKLRQEKYKEYLGKELDIETSEGLANYTGFAFSTNKNKYLKAVEEINQREQAPTYTRPFPYATGPAYCFIFDYLGIQWRTGLGKIYNFLEIYENKYLKKKIIYDSLLLEEANSRNNFNQIRKEELKRQKEKEIIIDYYTDQLVNKPVLTMRTTGAVYRFSYDMNGTITLKDKGIVYSMIKGDDVNQTSCGSFKTIAGKEKLGVSGVLGSFDGKEYTFPLPVKIEGKKITGEYYEINLNEGWKIIKVNGKGDLEIVRE